jgi:hypothetical protein
VNGLSRVSSGCILHLGVPFPFSLQIKSPMNISAAEQFVKFCGMIYHLSVLVFVRFIVDPVRTFVTSVFGGEMILVPAVRMKQFLKAASTSGVRGKVAAVPLFTVVARRSVSRKWTMERCLQAPTDELPMPAH